MKILTPNGFQDFQKIVKKESECIKFTFTDNESIECSIDHRFCDNGNEVFANTLKVGDTICGKEISKIENTGIKAVYSPINVERRAYLSFKRYCPL